MACNSLHLTELGLVNALNKIFQFNPKRVFLASELYPRIEVEQLTGEYSLLFTDYFQTESSFAYHHIGEMVDHRSYQKGGRLSAQEVQEITATLTFQDGHYWLKDITTVGMFCWERNDI